MLVIVRIAFLASNGIAIVLVDWRGLLANAAPRLLSNATALLLIVDVGCGAAVATPPGFARRPRRSWGGVLSLCHSCLCLGGGGVCRCCSSQLHGVLLDVASSIVFVFTPVCFFAGVAGCRPEAIVGDVFSLVKAIISIVFVSPCIWRQVLSVVALGLRSFAVPPRMGWGCMVPRSIWLVCHAGAVLSIRIRWLSGIFRFICLQLCSAFR